MTEAHDRRPGPIARLRDRLIVSASARHLAIELVERHGRAAGDAARTLAARGDLSPRQRRVLARAQAMIATLADPAAAPPARARRGYRTMAPAVAAD